MAKIVKKLMRKFDECTLGEQVVMLGCVVLVLGVMFGIAAYKNFGDHPVVNTPAAPAAIVDVIQLPGDTVTIVPTPSKRGIEQARVTKQPSSKTLPVATTTATSPEVTVSNSQPTPSTIATATSSVPPTSKEPLPASTSAAVIPSSAEASPSN